MNRKGSALVILSIIIVIIVVAVIVWFMFERSSSTPQISPSANASPSASSSAPAQPITWKTYQNTNFNFLIQYPSNWTVVDVATDTYGDITGFGVSFGIPNAGDLTQQYEESYDTFAGGVEVYPVSATATIPEAYQSITTLDLTTLATTSIDLAGVTSTEYLSIPGEINYNEAFIIHNGELYGVYQLPTSIDSDATFKKFAASLQFDI